MFFLDFSEFLFMNDSKIKTLCYLTLLGYPLLNFSALSLMTEGFNLTDAVLLLR